MEKVNSEKTRAEKKEERRNEIIRIQKKKSNFVMLDKGFIDNPNLSWKAKGILTYLLSKPDSWRVIIKDIVKHGTGGERAIYSGLNELKQAGYYRKYPVREGQRIVRWDSVVYECPEDCQEELKMKKSKKKEPKPMEKPQDSLLRGFVHVESEFVDVVHVENGYHSNIESNQNRTHKEIISINQGKQKEEEEQKNVTLDSTIDLIDSQTEEEKKTVNNNNNSVGMTESTEDIICLDETTEEEPINTEEEKPPVNNSPVNWAEIMGIDETTLPENNPLIHANPLDIPDMIAEKICLEELKYEYPDQEDLVTELYNIVCQVMTTYNVETMRIAKKDTYLDTVKKEFAQLEKPHFEYVLHCLAKNYDINSNAKSYFITTLFNSVHSKPIFDTYNKSCSRPAKSSKRWSSRESSYTIEDFYEKAVKRTRKS